MPKRSSKPTPPITPFSIVSQVTGPPFSADLNDAAVRRHLMQEMGRRGGLSGGKARASKLSPAERSAIARKAAAARWGRKA